MKMVFYLSFDSPALLLLLLSVLTYLSMLRSSSVARLASEPKSCVNRFDKLKSVWFLLSRQTSLRLLIRFELLSFFKKLSRNSPLIRSLFTYQFADCFIKFIWLNFYTMKFSRFKFSVVLNVFILTQPVNIVKRFFLFHQVFIKSMENFRRCCFATAWLLYQTAYALSRTFLNFFRTFSSRPIRFRVAVREKLVCSQATAWLYYHSLVFPSSAFRKLF